MMPLPDPLQAMGQINRATIDDCQTASSSSNNCSSGAQKREDMNIEEDVQYKTFMLQQQKVLKDMQLSREQDLETKSQMAEWLKISLEESAIQQAGVKHAMESLQEGYTDLWKENQKLRNGVQQLRSYVHCQRKVAVSSLPIKFSAPELLHAAKHSATMGGSHSASLHQLQQKGDGLQKKGSAHQTQLNTEQHSRHTPEAKVNQQQYEIHSSREELELATNTLKIRRSVDREDRKVSEECEDGAIEESKRNRRRGFFHRHKGKNKAVHKGRGIATSWHGCSAEKVKLLKIVSKQKEEEPDKVEVTQDCKGMRSAPNTYQNWCKVYSTKTLLEIEDESCDGDRSIPCHKGSSRDVTTTSNLELFLTSLGDLDMSAETSKPRRNFHSIKDSQWEGGEEGSNIKAQFMQSAPVMGDELAYFDAPKVGEERKRWRKAPRESISPDACESHFDACLASDDTAKSDKSDDQSLPLNSLNIKNNRKEMSTQNKSPTDEAYILEMNSKQSVKASLGHTWHGSKAVDIQQLKRILGNRKSSLSSGEWAPDPPTNRNEQDSKVMHLFDLVKSQEIDPPTTLDSYLCSLGNKTDDDSNNEASMDSKALFCENDHDSYHPSQMQRRARIDET
jgi:hypothetical protein